jgi:hypothetical protein
MLPRFLSEVVWGGFSIAMLILVNMLYLKLLVENLEDEILEKTNEKIIINEVGHGGVVS